MCDHLEVLHLREGRRHKISCVCCGRTLEWWREENPIAAGAVLVLCAAAVILFLLVATPR